MSWGLWRVRRARFAASRFCVAGFVVALFVQCGGSEEQIGSGAGASAGTAGRGGSDSGRGGSGASAGSAGSTGGSDAAPDASTGATGGLDASVGDVSVDGDDDARPDGERDAAPEGADAGITLVDRCGTLAPATVTALRAGGPVGDMKWLYPYDRTVFPRGILPPVLQWSGRMAEAVLVVVKAKNFEYRGCFGSTNPLRLRDPRRHVDERVGRGIGPD